MEPEGIRFNLNGAATTVRLDPDTPLLTALRSELGLRGSRFGCGTGHCGACSVLLDERTVSSCDLPLWAVAGKSVTTVEGLGSERSPHPLQAAFIAEQAVQSGYCVPGILIRLRPEFSQAIARGKIFADAQGAASLRRSNTTASACTPRPLPGAATDSAGAPAGRPLPRTVALAGQQRAKQTSIEIVDSAPQTGGSTCRPGSANAHIPKTLSHFGFARPQESLVPRRQPSHSVFSCLSNNLGVG